MYNEPPSEKDKGKLLKTYIVGKYSIYLYEMGAFGESFCPVSQKVEMNYIFSDNGRTLCSSCNVNKLKTTAILSKKSRNKCRSHRF